MRSFPTKKALTLVGVLGVVLIIGIALVSSGVIAPTVIFGTPDEYEQATVSFVNERGYSTTVNVTIADTEMKRYVGLSNADRLPNGSGMLFVYEKEAKRTLKMRGMEYGLDFIFIGDDKQVVGTASAPAPPDGVDGTTINRTGKAKYVIEAPNGWSERENVTVGDSVWINRTGKAENSTPVQPDRDQPAAVAF